MAEKTKHDFRKCTEDGLKACARWLERNADQLADTIADGCTGWSVEFEWSGSDEYVPEIHVMVDKVDRDVIEAYWGR